MPPSALPIELLGVMLDSSSPGTSSCLVRCTYPNGPRLAATLEIGATACDLAEIREIRQGEVVVRNLLTNRLERLPLRQTGPAAVTPAPETAPPQPEVVSATPELVKVDVPKASVEHYLLNLPELLSSAQATPRYRGGAIEGFEISQIKAGSVVERLGLRNGDVILEVNGQKLDSLAAVLKLVGQAQAASQATLTVERDGARKTFVFNTR